jgi:hypothetical protein
MLQAHLSPLHCCVLQACRNEAAVLLLRYWLLSCCMFRAGSATSTWHCTRYGKHDVGQWTSIRMRGFHVLQATGKTSLLNSSCWCSTAAQQQLRVMQIHGFACRTVVSLRCFVRRNGVALESGWPRCPVLLLRGG